MTDAGPPALALDGISRRFGGVVAVDGVSLTLGAGERVSVIGPNGAGKTTLFRLIAGEMRPSGGNINLLGRDVTRMPAHHRAGGGRGGTRPRPNLPGLEPVRRPDGPGERQAGEPDPRRRPVAVLAARVR
jgi:branched-chain amino acid transport system ATP-binding protein